MICLTQKTWEHFTDAHTSVFTSEQLNEYILEPYNKQRAKYHKYEI